MVGRLVVVVGVGAAQIDKAGIVLAWPSVSPLAEVRRQDQGDGDLVGGGDAVVMEPSGEPVVAGGDAGL
ncbi:hypothetical protein ACVCAH_32465 [Micromonospora sp. LZ34]